MVGPWQSSSFLSNKEVKVSAPLGLPQGPTLISDSRCVGRGAVLLLIVPKCHVPLGSLPPVLIPSAGLLIDDAYWVPFWQVHLIFPYKLPGLAERALTC